MEEDVEREKEREERMGTAKRKKRNREKRSGGRERKTDREKSYRLT